MRQRYKPWADDFLNSNSRLVIPDAEKHKGSWNQLFGNNYPIHLEIGTGKGQFLAGMAAQYPHINFIGIELGKSVIVSAAEKIIDAEVDNVLLLNVNAEKLTSLFADGEIASLYLNFSDPWPKNRHAKRRLTFPSFLKLYKQVLKPEGSITLKTDNQALFEYSIVSFSGFGMTLQEVILDLHGLSDPENVMTEYEEKFAAKGQLIYRCSAVF
jgi:tRNA (guanine-N7-)-methyltransferase